MSEANLPAPDIRILRDLARRVADHASDPIQEERIRAWKRHNALQSGRPLVLIFPEGAWRELVPERLLICSDPRARTWERQLRQTLHQASHFRCDNVVTADLVVPKCIHNSGWGLEANWRFSDTAHGARAFDPVLLARSDLAKLHHPRIEYDEARSLAFLELARDVFGGILQVRLQGVAHISYHLMAEFTRLRGLEPALIDMMDEPNFVHDAMRFLTEGHKSVLAQYQAQDLLCANNNNTYHSTGGNGWIDGLCADGQPIRPSQLWASAESQELTVVSPKMHRDFAMAYEAELLEPFGLTGYGCCEDLTRKIDDVLTLPRIRRISISPFADVATCAHGLRDRRAIMSWKPQPSRLVGNFDEDVIRADLEHGIHQAKIHDCCLEIILKDTHTCEHHPERFDRWTDLCHEALASCGMSTSW